MTGMVLAKLLHYILLLSILILLGFLVNYYYVTIFFSGEIFSFTQLIPSAVLFMIYYSFTISLILLFSSLFRTGMITGIGVLLLSFGLSSLQNIQPLQMYLPYNLIARASKIGEIMDGSLWITLACTLLFSIVFVWFAIIRMKTIEVV